MTDKTFATVTGSTPFALHSADHSRILTIVKIERWGDRAILTDGAQWYSATLGVEDGEALAVAYEVNAYASQKEAERNAAR